MLMDVGTHFGPFSGRNQYAESAYSTLVLLLFHDLRGPTNDVKSELKCSIPNMMLNVFNMAPLGFHFEVMFGTFGGSVLHVMFWLENGCP